MQRSARRLALFGERSTTTIPAPPAPPPAETQAHRSRTTPPPPSRAPLHPRRTRTPSCSESNEPPDRVLVEKTSPQDQSPPADDPIWEFEASLPQQKMIHPPASAVGRTCTPARRHR